MELTPILTVATNELRFGDDTFSNIVTQNKTLTDEQKRDLTLCWARGVRSYSLC